MLMGFLGFFFVRVVFLLLLFWVSLGVCVVLLGFYCLFVVVVWVCFVVFFFFWGGGSEGGKVYV